MVLDLKGEALIGPEQMEVAEQFIVPNIPNVYSAISLFWNMYQPWVTLVHVPKADVTDNWQQLGFAPAPPSTELDHLLFRSLDWIYNKFRVHYMPDADDFRNLLDLVTELHIGAARVSKQRQLEKDQISEEWVSRLREVEGVANRIRAIMRPRSSPGYDNTSLAVSTNAVWDMIQLELSHVCRANGSYAEAIHYLDQASTSYIWALDGIEDTRGSDSYWAGVLRLDDESIRNSEIITRIDLRRRLTPLPVSATEAAAPFNLLKHSPPSDANWRQIADDCRGLAVLPDLEWEVFSSVEASEYVEDRGTHFELSWSEFWHAAAAWASAQLSPSEFRKALKDIEVDAAERRLVEILLQRQLALPA